jgi:Cofactor assembly of complex C subunit B, CCB2/CCB4
VLVLLCLALPTLEKQLNNPAGGAGRRATEAQVAGSGPVFVFDKTLPDAVTKELAWATFACLRNTNTCAVIVVSDGNVLLARGALGTACMPARGNGGHAKVQLSDVGKVVSSDLQKTQQVLADLPANGLHVSSRKEMAAAQLDTWQCIPSGCQGGMVLPLGEGDTSGQLEQAKVMIALSEFDGGYSAKDQTWLRSISKKLTGVLQR